MSVGGFGPSLGLLPPRPVVSPGRCPAAPPPAPAVWSPCHRQGLLSCHSMVLVPVRGSEAEGQPSSHPLFSPPLRGGPGSVRAGSLYQACAWAPGPSCRPAPPRALSAPFPPLPSAPPWSSAFSLQLSPEAPAPSHSGAEALVVRSSPLWLCVLPLASSTEPLLKAPRPPGWG